MLLDTCALLWLGQGGGRLSQAAMQQIEAAPVVYVSAISGFEIGVKVAEGKLSLPARPAEWLATVIQHHDLRELPWISPPACALPSCPLTTQTP